MSELVTDAMVEVARALLAAEGADSQDGWHSWRCFDTARYPEPCDCTAQAARSALEAVAPAIAAEALRDFDDRVRLPRQWHERVLEDALRIERGEL